LLLLLPGSWRLNPHSDRIGPTAIWSVRRHYGECGDDAIAKPINLELEEVVSRIRERPQTGSQDTVPTTW
jgi:hypothetical protein